MIKRLMHDLFHVIPASFPRLCIGLILGPRDDTRADMENSIRPRALDIKISDWCCSVSMVWVQIPSREEQNFVSSKI